MLIATLPAYARMRASMPAVPSSESPSMLKAARPARVECESVRKITLHTSLSKREDFPENCALAPTPLQQQTTKACREVNATQRKPSPYGISLAHRWHTAGTSLPHLTKPSRQTRPTRVQVVCNPESTQPRTHIRTSPRNTLTHSGQRTVLGYIPSTFLTSPLPRPRPPPALKKFSFGNTPPATAPNFPKARIHKLLCKIFILYPLSGHVILPALGCLWWQTPGPPNPPILQF